MGTDDDVTQELVRLERAGWDALCTGTGDRFYADLMTSDGLMVLADGSVLDRDAVADGFSAAVDFGVTQVVDGNWGIHAILSKQMFEQAYRR